MVLLGLWVVHRAGRCINGWNGVDRAGGCPQGWEV